MPDDPAIRAMVPQIQRFPELAGCMIGYEGDGYSQLLLDGFLTRGRPPADR